MIDIIWVYIISQFTGLLSIILFPLITIIMSFMGIGYYTMSTDEYLTLVTKYKPISQCMTLDGTPVGLALHKKYIGKYPFGDPYRQECYVISTKIFMKEFMGDDGYIKYIKHNRNAVRLVNIRMRNLIPTKCQIDVINKIDKLDDRIIKIIYLCGPTGVGKSTIGFILAERSRSKIYFDYTPWNTNTDIEYVMLMVNPTRNNQLIVVIDEIDTLIDRIINNNPFPHTSEEKRELDGTKASWCKYFDSLKHMATQGVTFIITSNRHWNSYGEDYLFRKGRFDLTIEMTE